MSQPLPQRNFKWVTDDGINNFDVGQISDDSKTGYKKTMENLRNHVNVELVTSPERLRKVLAKPSLKSFKIFDENLAAVEVQKTVLTLNRPIYVGMTILDLSKTLMYDFFYNHLRVKYGEDVKLCMTDTDSFLVV